MDWRGGASGKEREGWRMGLVAALSEGERTWIADQDLHRLVAEVKCYHGHS